MTEMISAENLAIKTPSGRSLLAGIDFQLRGGETLLVAGPNGIGKSTFLRACLYEPKLRSGLFSSSLSHSEIAFLPQLQNTAIHLPYTLLDVLGTVEKRDVAAEKSAKVGLLAPGLLSRGWNQASGGERQKTLLTRALIESKKLLVLDEPMNHLDQEARLTLNKILSSYTTNGDRALMLVTHEPAQASEHSGRKVLDLKDYKA